MRIKTYVINLPESEERRKYVLGETAKYPFMDVSLIEAVYGKKLTEEEINRVFDCNGFFRRYFRYPAPGEIGCTLSHRKCYEALLSSNDQSALILEDDVSFVHPEDTESVIGAGMKLLEDGQTDIVFFAPKACYYTKPKTVLPTYTAFPIYTAVETCAYLINRRGAERMLRTDRPSIVADDFNYMCRQGIRIKCIRPHIAIGLSTVNQMDTDIEGRVWRTDKISFAMRVWSIINWNLRKMYILSFMRMGWMVDKAIFYDPDK